MNASQQSDGVWQRAQEAEQGHWADLWQAENSDQRNALVAGETIKGEYIFQQMLDRFRLNPDQDWRACRVLDVGCGPISLVARHGYGRSRAGVDPLNYPNWVYRDYEQQNFTVYKVPFEEFRNRTKYDVVIFYNALQHFADLEAVAQQCKKVLAKNGHVYLSEYLEVPTNEAHIQFLQADKLDELFGRHGFTVDATVLPVRLPGYVERPGGLPIDLYVARLSHGL